MVGIYLITNIINNKVYIGQSKNISQRWNSHKKDSYRPKDEEYNTPLHQAIRKYGLENFKFEILEECLISNLDEREKHYISLYESYPLSKNKGYNQTPGGQGPSSKIWEHLEEVDELLKNSDLTQKEIALKFNITEEMIQGINTGRYWRRDSIEYPIRERRTRNGVIWGSRMKNYCSICGKEIWHGGKCCVQCKSEFYKNEGRKKGILISIPSKEEILKTFYELKNCQKVADKYNISTVLLKKWRRELQLPEKVKDTIELYEREYLGVKKDIYTKPKILKLDPVSMDVVQTFNTRREAALSVGCNLESTTGINEAIKNKKLYKNFYWALA